MYCCDQRAGFHQFELRNIASPGNGHPQCFRGSLVLKEFLQPDTKTACMGPDDIVIARVVAARTLEDRLANTSFIEVGPFSGH